MTSLRGPGKEILMPYPINRRAHQFNSIQSVPVSFGLWDTALKFLSPGPRVDVTDLLVMSGSSAFLLASHEDVLRGSSRVPAQERVTNPKERLRGRLRSCLLKFTLLYMLNFLRVQPFKYAFSSQNLMWLL